MRLVDPLGKRAQQGFNSIFGFGYLVTHQIDSATHGSTGRLCCLDPCIRVPCDCLLGFRQAGKDIFNHMDRLINHLHSLDRLLGEELQTPIDVPDLPADDDIRHHQQGGLHKDQTCHDPYQEVDQGQILDRH